METEDLIQFSNGRPVVPSPNTTGSKTGSNDNPKKADKATDALHDDDDDDDGLLDHEDDEDEDGTASSRTADEQMDYLESLEPCPCYAKCCIDSVITLFCVTLLG